MASPKTELRRPTRAVDFGSGLAVRPREVALFHPLDFVFNLGEKTCDPPAIPAGRVLLAPEMIPQDHQLDY